jgi:GT2 family glycosyltransferase
MTHASHPFLAFLDADDVYLPNRFGVPLRILQSEPSLHGVYEATGLFFESPAAEARWRSASLGSRHLTTLRRSVHPEDLFEAMWPLGWDGHFHLNALTLRTKALELVGGFDEELLLHQDTAFCVRLSALVRLGPGRLDRAVATYRIHEENRVTAPRSPPQVHRDHIRMWRALWAWARGGGLEGDRLRHLYDRLAQDLLSAPGEDRGFLRRLTKRARRGARVLRLAPELLLDAELVVWVLSRTSGRFRH